MEEEEVEVEHSMEQLEYLQQSAQEQELEQVEEEVVVAGVTVLEEEELMWMLLIKMEYCWEDPSLEL